MICRALSASYHKSGKLVHGIQYDIDTQLKLLSFTPQKPAVEELRELAQGSPSKEFDQSGSSRTSGV